MLNFYQYKVILVYLSCLLMMFLSGCTIKRNAIIDDIGKIPEPLVEPLPLNVGIYYADGFKNYKTTQIIVFPNDDITLVLNVELGKANVELFNYLFNRTFERMTPLEQISEDTDAGKSIDLIIEPVTTEYEYYDSGSPFFTRKVSIEYELKMFLPNGTQINSWRFNTTSVAEKSTYWGHGANCKGVTKEAMRDIATKYFVGFRDHIGITKKNCGNYNQ